MTTFDRARGAGRRRHTGPAGHHRPPGAGKTTLAEHLIQTLAPAPPPALLPGQWIAHVPMGDDIVYAPGFERTLEQPLAGAIPVPASARLIITEGNYLLFHDHGWDRVRDAALFPEPDRFDIHRTSTSHVAFGHGIHHCIGAPLARLEAKIALGILLERYGEIAMDAAAPIEFHNPWKMISAKRLPVLIV